MEQPETRYARTPDGLRIAYQVEGAGSIDIALLPNFVCVDVMRDEASFAHALRRLAGIGRTICFDYRGFGSSDDVPLGGLPTAEEWMEDVRVVLDVADSSSAVVIANGFAGFMGMLFAATYPERTRALVLIDTWAYMLRDDEYPFGIPQRFVDAVAEEAEKTWGTGSSGAAVAPSRSDDAGFLRWAGRLERLGWTPSMAAAVMRWASRFDLRPILPAIHVPTLVIHRRDNPTYRPGHGQYLARHITDAKLVLLPGTDTLFFTQDADRLLDEVQEFVTGARPVSERDRTLATVLFTDIVSSAERTAAVGDLRWRDLLDQHDAAVSSELDRHRGRKVHSIGLGDGVLATFDGPARAVRCAHAIQDAVRRLGLDIRAGLHTGEVESRGEDITGIAVTIARRVTDLGGAGEVLVSRTVTDLVAGSGLQFEERGEHELKGIPGSWAIYAVMP